MVMTRNFWDFFRLFSDKSFRPSKSSSLRCRPTSFRVLWILRARIGMLCSRLLLEERSFTLLVLLANLGICGAKMVDTAHIDLPRRVLCQVVHDVITNIVNCSVTTQRDSTYRVHADVIKKGNHDRLADIFEDLLGERWTVRVGVDLRVRICHGCLFLNVALSLDKLGCESVYSLTIMIIAL